MKKKTGGPGPKKTAPSKIVPSYFSGKGASQNVVKPLTNNKGGGIVGGNVRGQKPQEITKAQSEGRAAYVSAAMTGTKTPIKKTSPSIDVRLHQRDSMDIAHKKKFKK